MARATRVKRKAVRLVRVLKYLRVLAVETGYSGFQNHAGRLWLAATRWLSDQIGGSELLLHLESGWNEARHAQPHSPQTSISGVFFASRLQHQRTVHALARLCDVGRSNLQLEVTPDPPAVRAPQFSGHSLARTHRPGRT
jgi:hypothetical protein